MTRYIRRHNTDDNSRVHNVSALARRKRQADIARRSGAFWKLGPSRDLFRVMKIFKGSLNVRRCMYARIVRIVLGFTCRSRIENKRAASCANYHYFVTRLPPEIERLRSLPHVSRSAFQFSDGYLGGGGTRDATLFISRLKIHDTRV